MTKYVRLDGEFIGQARSWVEVLDMLPEEWKRTLDAADLSRRGTESPSGFFLNTASLRLSRAR